MIQPTDVGKPGLAVWIALFVGVMTSLSPGVARGAPDDKSKARDLFLKGAEAVEAGRAAEGLPLLVVAESLFHAPTHLLYIARAQAATGKLLAARETYKKLAGETLPPKASKPFVEAQESGKKELVAIDGRIPKVVVRVAPAAEGLEVTLDDQALPRALGEPIEVDPGAHKVVARAPGFLERTVTVSVLESRTTEVRVQLAGEKKVDVAPAPEPTDGGWTAPRIASIPLMAVGGAGLVAGGAMGIVSLLKTSDADEQFETCGVPCRDEITSLDEEAATLGTASIIGMAAGAAILGTGIVLFVLGAEDEPTPAQSGSTRMLAGPGFVGVHTTF